VTTLSVLTPSYNYARFIEDAIVSVARQPMPLEHLVQDGLSTDETTSVLRRHEGVSWVSEEDSGQSDALNRALGRALGRWVSWLNADEFYLPHGLQALIAHGEESGADVVYGDAIFVDEGGRLLRLVPQHRFSGSILHNYGTFISTCACVIRRGSFPEDPFDERLRLLMDRDVFMKLMVSGARFAYLPIPVGAFRMHGERVSAGEEATFAQDRAVIASRYGPVSRLARVGARGAHGAAKALSRGYVRQRRARSLAGADTRWFATTEGDATMRSLYALYGREVPAAAV
jgi:glycosyltransferase involved in cell wall biosynthesis